MKMRFLAYLHTSYRVSGIPVGREPHSKRKEVSIMKSFHRKHCIAVISLFLIWSMVLNVCAAAPPTVSPLWQNAHDVTCTLSFDETDGTAYCNIYAKSGTTSIKGTLMLYCVNNPMRTWNINTTQNTVTIDKNFIGISGKAYRLVLDVNIVTNGVSEPVRVTKTATCP